MRAAVREAEAEAMNSSDEDYFTRHKEHIQLHVAGAVNAALDE